jgi:hypothetical protein
MAPPAVRGPPDPLAYSCRCRPASFAVRAVAALVATMRATGARAQRLAWEASERAEIYDTNLFGLVRRMRAALPIPRTRPGLPQQLDAPVAT